MKNPDFSTCTQEQLTQWVDSASSDDIQRAATQFSEDHISPIVNSLRESPRLAEKLEKTRAIVLGLSERPQIEEVGRSVDLSQALDLIDHHRELETEGLWKLGPLFVGLPTQVFTETLTKGTKPQLDVLKHEGVTEPIQHHLTLLSLDLTQRLETLTPELDSLTQQIQEVDFTTCTKPQFTSLITAIDTLRRAYQQILELSNEALAIAWNTNREDLVEKYNTIKTTAHRGVTEFVGYPKSNSRQPSGLFTLIEQALNSVYSSPDTPPLDDDTPAIEALVTFKLWYLKDYWEIGLFPSITSPDQLNLDPSTHSEEQCLQRREELFAQARRNMEKAGLTTVCDLKQALIFSRETLQDHLRTHLD